MRARYRIRQVSTIYTPWELWLRLFVFSTVDDWSQRHPKCLTQYPREMLGKADYLFSALITRVLSSSSASRS